MSDFKGRHFRGEIVLWAVRVLASGSALLEPVAPAVHLLPLVATDKRP